MKFKSVSYFTRRQAWHTRPDDVSDLSISRPISLNCWESATLKSFTLLETLKRFYMKRFIKILRIWSWEDNNKVYNYRSHFTRFLPWQSLSLAAIEQTPHDSTVSQLLFAAKLSWSKLWLTVMIRFTKLALGFSPSERLITLRYSSRATSKFLQFFSSLVFFV